MRIISDPIVPRKFFLFKRKNCAILYEIKYTARACDGIGRHAGFRFPCFQRVGSSPFRRTRTEHHDEKSWCFVLYELHTNGQKGGWQTPSPFLPYIDKKSQRLSFPVRNGLFAQGTSAKFLCSLIPPQDQFAKQTFIKKTPRRSSWCFFLVRLKGLEPTR